MALGRAAVRDLFWHRRGLVLLCRISAATLSLRRCGNILMLCEQQGHEGRGDPTARRCAKANPQDHPPDQIDTLADNIGMPISGINMTYNTPGVIGRRMATSDQAQRRPPPDRRLCPAAAEQLPRSSRLRVLRSCR